MWDSTRLRECLQRCKHGVSRARSPHEGFVLCQGTRDVWELPLGFGWASVVPSQFLIAHHTCFQIN
ncbi:uncharacterized protein B0I36DRAFT_328288 [Microdochium trichocladiopsis]|uniref:Uncharacterized protein n=1 Tax=Microdochium trichocladiopsis TaxID=1682393 RepID=A0A9P8Y5D0_9PEZI|nr:uncharacterized protein B0I36DRAFT_328288 [Microdochium trichocladiopsis]KAH7027935.1 hypothetical protein B0I36DRAFT_328288 [Microdochium trichocladiopsis]